MSHSKFDPPTSIEVSGAMAAAEGARFGAFCDVAHPSWASGHGELLTFSDRYLAAAESGVWPSAYPWPHDALRCNTRAWEYPYVVDAVSRRVVPGGRILDIGSALTFLPAFLASRAFEVTASDNDPRMASWWTGIKPALLRRGVLEATARLQYQTVDVTALEFGDATFDAVTNVSVLEHLPVNLLRESLDQIARVLKPGGILVCTLDCWLAGRRTVEHHPLDQGEFDRFMDSVTARFSLLDGERNRVPSDLITNLSYPDTQAPIVRSAPSARRSLSRRVRRAIRALLGREEAKPLEWCVFGFTARKRAE